MPRLTISWPRFMTTLSFRISALFLLLLAISFGVNWLWVNATLLGSNATDSEEEWYGELASAELDSLARLVGSGLDDLNYVQERLVVFGESARRYDAEIVLTDQEGQVIASSAPDSLSAAVGQVNPALLDSMADTDWDFAVYPVPGNLDAYENRIFEVDRVYAANDSTVAATGYLVTSFQMITFNVAEIERDIRNLLLQSVAIILVCAAISGLIIMAWLSRRIQHLRAGVNALANGDLSQRVSATSPDEIGSLGRHFNTMAERLENLVDELRRKETFQRQLIANISHDLRTPMASLRGYVETLSLNRDRLSTAETDRYLEIINGNLLHLDKLVDHLLQLSRLDAGQARAQTEEFPLLELVDEVLHRCGVFAGDRSVRLHSESATEVATVLADPLQIGQVLQNLIENGIKFNQAGGEVVVTMQALSAGVEVAVRDNGQGIPDDDLPHVFERFYTGDKSRSRKGESSGLGLAIARKILDGHGCELKVASIVGEGTTFSFILPAGQEITALSAEA